MRVRLELRMIRDGAPTGLVLRGPARLQDLEGMMHAQQCIKLPRALVGRLSPAYMGIEMGGGDDEVIAMS